MVHQSRKCSATGRLVTSKDHASVQLCVVDVDETGRSTGTYSTFVFGGPVRRMGEADSSLNLLATKAGYLKKYQYEFVYFSGF